MIGTKLGHKSRIAQECYKTELTLILANHSWMFMVDKHDAFIYKLDKEVGYPLVNSDSLDPTVPPPPKTGLMVPNLPCTLFWTAD